MRATSTQCVYYAYSPGALLAVCEYLESQTTQNQKREQN